MFYYYSIVSKPLTSALIEKETCPVCSKKGTLEVILYMKFVAMIIPMYGLGRSTSIHCCECGHEIKSVSAPILTELFNQKKYSPEILNAIKSIKTNHKRTLWQLFYPWSLTLLLGIAAICALAMQYVLNQNNTQSTEMLANPKIGDVYKVSIDSMYSLDESTMASKRSQTLFKIIDIKNDTLMMVRNKQQSEGMGIKENDWELISRDDSNYETKIHKISQKAIAEYDQMFEFLDQKTIDSLNQASLMKSTNQRFSKSIGQIAKSNGIITVERK